MSKYHVFYLKLLLVGMALATAWAVRGQFGHEQGAAWAGAIGVLTLLILTGKQNWYHRMPAIVAIGAIGWGAGGMMSYGQVVGYARGLDFLNVSYGLLCLFLIGGLYGFLGGGLTGMSLASTDLKKPDWAMLLAQMVAGAYLVWGLLIYQLEWLMTPPRSELWAACLGAALALGWYAYRNGFHRSLKVGLFAGLGAGFGFAFGNFLQVMGNNTSIDFNWWNVMEYSLGFFGGLGMAYGVFTEKWPEDLKPDPASNILGWVLLVLFIPLANLIQTFSEDRLVNTAEHAGLTEIASFVRLEKLLSWGSLLLIGGGISLIFRKKISGARDWSGKQLSLLLALVAGWYILLSNVLTATWINSWDTKEYLYWVNLLIIVAGVNYALREESYFPKVYNYRQLWMQLSLTIFLALLFLSFILINSHNGLPGVQRRFVWQ
ncbi:MAG: hypothetical protein ACLFQO_17105 [Cyclobacteriaceae bacterium]